MQCDPFKISIKTWLDGELRGPRAAEVERHLAACPECRAVAQDYRRISERLQAFGGLAVPIPPAEGIRARARELQQTEARVIRFLRKVAAVAAVFLITTSGLAGWYCIQDSDSSPSSQGQKIERDEALYLVITYPTWEEED